MGSAAESWDDYWQSNRISSSIGNYGDNLASYICEDWARYFGEVKNGSSILDICTGNGIVPLIALKTALAKHRKFSITGIDQAHINPAQNVSKERSLLNEIDFIGGVDASKLPFKNSSFDIVTSQYGLEYTDWEKTTTELYRVLKQKGRGRFIVHALDGYIIKHNVPKITQCETIVGTNIFQKAEAAMLLKWRVNNKQLLNNRKTRTVLKKYIQTLNDTIFRLCQKFINSAQFEEIDKLVTVLKSALKNLNRFYGESQISQWVNGNKKALMQRRLRLTDLQCAAKDEKGLKEMTAVMKNVGFVVDNTVELFMLNTGALIGYVITVQKP